MRVVGYVRVSTEEQARTGISIDMQKDRINKLAEEKSWDLIGIMEDKGYSAKNVKRPGYQMLLQLIEFKHVDCLAVYKVDRLCRYSPDMMDLRRLLDNTGVGLHCINEPFNIKEGGGRFLLTIHAGLAEQERDTTIERTKAALAELQRQGKRTGSIPYGFTVDENNYLIHSPYEQNVIKWIKKFMKQDSTYWGIMTTLNLMGFKNRKNSQFTDASIRRLCLKVKKGEV